MDLCTALLGVDLEDEIYMNPLQEYFHLLQNRSRYYDPRSKTSRMMVLRLRKSLYGLKQFLQVWYGTCKNFVIPMEYVGSHIDGGLFLLEDLGAVITIVGLYVDDLLSIANEGLIGQVID
jgi:hypothetical protein